MFDIIILHDDTLQFFVISKTLNDVDAWVHLCLLYIELNQLIGSWQIICNTITILLLQLQLWCQIRQEPAERAQGTTECNWKDICSAGGGSGNYCNLENIMFCVLCVYVP